MNDDYRTKSSDLLKVWLMPKGGEFKQLTVRLPVETACKIQALETMFPTRSRNELVSDLLTTALTEFEESLPCEGVGEPFHVDEEGEYYEEYRGPQVRFRTLYESFMKEGNKVDESFIKPVKGVEEESA